MWIVVYVCIYPGGCVFIYIYVYVYAYISVYLQMCYLVIRFLFTIIIYIYLLLCYAQLRPQDILPFNYTPTHEWLLAFFGCQNVLCFV